MHGSIKTTAEIAIIAEGGKILGDILRRTAALVRPGVTTAELNDFAEREIGKAGGRPSFIGYGPKNNPFPAGLCTSVNDVVVHGIPSKRVTLKEGDIIGLDIGMEYKGFYTDTAVTVPVGKVSGAALNLIHTARKCLEESIKQARVGNRIGDIASTIQRIAESAGYTVIRDLVGHGVGYAVHEDPAVPCYGKPGTGLELKPGMVLAIEPMLTMGNHKIYFGEDGWTIRTMDRSLAAHFEHTIALTKDGPVVLT